jgi:hypothetical protein
MGCWSNSQFHWKPHFQPPIIATHWPSHYLLMLSHAYIHLWRSDHAFQFMINHAVLASTEYAVAVSYIFSDRKKVLLHQSFILNHGLSLYVLQCIHVNFLADCITIGQMDPYVGSTITWISQLCHMFVQLFHYSTSTAGNRINLGCLSHCTVSVSCVCWFNCVVDTFSWERLSYVVQTDILMYSIWCIL